MATLAEKVCVYVYPKRGALGAAGVGYYIGDTFENVGDATRFIQVSNRPNGEFPALGRCKVVPASDVYPTV